MIGRFLLGLLALLLPLEALAGRDLDRMRGRQFLMCGINVAVPGYAMLGSDGIWRGLEPDLCRAIAVAVFGDPTAIRYVPLSSEERFAALQGGRIDVLVRQSSYSLRRDSVQQTRLVTPTHLDGHSFMVATPKLGEGLAGMAGGRICVARGSSNAVTTQEVFDAAGLSFTPVALSRPADLTDALIAGRCDAIGHDASTLAALRVLLPQPEAFSILPQYFSKEVMGPMIRPGDPDLFDIVRWVIMALMEAEELGITSENAEALRRGSTSPAVRRLLGEDGDAGKLLRIAPNWAYQVIRAVGNYGEIFDRNLGADSPLKLDRGVNKLWTQGGLVYALPLR